MIDIKYIRANPDIIREAIRNKNEKADLDALLSADEERRRLQYQFDNLKAQQNSVSQIIATKKRAREDAAAEIAEMGKVAAEIKAIQADLSQANALMDRLMLTIPNIPEEGVPIGLDESLNEVIRHEGEPLNYDFELKDHLDIAEANRLLDLPRGAKISGSGFPIYSGFGARLERCIINFMLEYHLQKHGYTELMVPLAVNRKAMTGTGQLPKLEEDMYHIAEDDLFLIPTAEVPVTNIYADEVLSYKDLPKKFVAYTPCFRREAGSYGKDTRGLQRLHQFNKVEMVRFVQPEDSQAALDEMLQDAEDILKAFGLHYRVLSLCSGDLSFASQRTYDLEVWAPGSQKYLEVSSVSNFGEFQARRANIRYKDAEGKLRHLHTLNGSGVATPRLMIALLETYQQADGSLKLPEAIRPWLELKI
ncbi:MAG: serine--tRNA ligase [Candidatus Cloacimonadaceae bacterium]|jgi:seryl-tRNA synthetase|nr:serine--tRNA ligase [Candidatus Cloacimonadota bacterium]MDY0127180.1 serine--tRNA ligase [Candidatus Cloacimonadaceae bacterium]MCB5254421.1 serine--tRNA ligase [Candidatus Cloacimonadota bacterium]MCK9178095.1 serine--tRNA ligase [Candidatus Cloacimonadota bacterium]MCK9241850.1 serine--tRNA ligase [Candidatus Cloacimonadota bacterium]